MQEPEKRYSVVIPVSGVLTVEVIARTEDEATASARSRLSAAIQSIQGGVFIMQPTSMIPIEHKELSRLVSL